MAEEQLKTDETIELSISAAKAFQPRSPISTRELFAGRWEQVTALVDAVSQKGLHIVIFGERGVGKTSLANIIEPLLQVMEERPGHKAPDRLVVKVNVHQGDTFGEAWGRSFSEVTWYENKPMFGFMPKGEMQSVSLKKTFELGDLPTIDEVRRTLEAVSKFI